MRQLETRINKIIGQLESVKKYINDPDYECEDVIQQLKAVSGSVKSLGKAFAEEEINKCLKKKMKKRKIEERIQLLLDIAFK